MQLLEGEAAATAARARVRARTHARTRTHANSRCILTQHLLNLIQLMSIRRLEIPLTRLHERGSCFAADKGGLLRGKGWDGGGKVEGLGLRGRRMRERRLKLQLLLLTCSNQLSGREWAGLFPGV